MPAQATTTSQEECDAAEAAANEVIRRGYVTKLDREILVPFRENLFNLEALVIVLSLKPDHVIGKLVSSLQGAYRILDEQVTH